MSAPKRVVRFAWGALRGTLVIAVLVAALLWADNALANPVPRIVSGSIPAAGTTPTSGSGFTYTHATTGIYIFSYTTAFLVAPVITVTMGPASPLQILDTAGYVTASSTSGFTVETEFVNGAASNLPFYFKAADPGPFSGTLSLAGSLSDVSISSPSSGQFLKYNGTGWVNSALPTDTDVTAISGLSDVAVSSPVDGQFLTYVASTGKWTNQTISLGGGSGATCDSTTPCDVNIVGSSQLDSVNTNLVSEISHLSTMVHVLGWIVGVLLLVSVAPVLMRTFGGSL